MGCVTFSELERVGLLMGSVGDNYRCRLCGRVDVGAYAPDWLGYPICTKEHNGCLNKVRDGHTAPEILGASLKRVLHNYPLTQIPGLANRVTSYIR